MGSPNVYITASVGPLAFAVAAGLWRLHVPATALPWTPPLHGLLLAPGSVLVVVSSDCPPERVPPIARKGLNTVVLTPLLRDAEQRQYVRYGAAAYLPMDMDLRPLAETINALRERAVTSR